jgi:hypothetical protein
MISKVSGSGSLEIVVAQVWNVEGNAMHTALTTTDKDIAPTAPTRGETSNISRFARRETEPGFAI